IEGQRQAAGGRQVEHLVALPPVFDEGDVGAGDGGGRGHDGAPAGAATMSVRNPSYPAACQRASTSRVCPGASAMTAPPPPAPVSLAPTAPAARAACTSVSSSGDDSRNAASKPCEASMIRPRPSTSPFASASPAS